MRRCATEPAGSAGRRLSMLPRMACLAIVAVIACVGGCGLAEPTEIQVAVPRIECDNAQIDPPPVLTCEAAVEAAIRQVGDPGAVDVATFHYGRPCAPNERCAPMTTQAGYVVIQLRDGQCAFVSLLVGPELSNPPSVSISTLESWPPREWGVDLLTECA